MIGRPAFLTLLAIGILAGAPGLAAQAPGYPHHPRAEWRHQSHRWAGHGEPLERHTLRCGHYGARLERQEVHRFRHWERRRHLVRHHLARRRWHRQWDGII
jgi:hypothetical protein